MTMKQILIVDDEVLFTKSLAEGLSTLEPSWHVLMAKNGKVALDVLEENQVQLVVTDLKMPVMDGFQLLAHLATHHGELPVIAMSAFATPEMEEKLQSLGIDKILEKPLDLVTFHEKLRSTLEASAKGFIRGITLPTFLQMIEMEKKTCTISVVSGEKSGTLYFREGTLFDAEAGDLTGVTAAVNLLSWEETGIEIRNACKVGKRIIKIDLQHLLLECMRLKDEAPNREFEQPESGMIQEQREPAHSIEAVGTGTTGLFFSGIEQFTELEGLLGLAVVDGDGKVLMTWPEGKEESLALTADFGCKIALASDLACSKMNVGRSLLTHFEAEGEHILIKELQPSDLANGGNLEARCFLLLVLDPDCQMGMARMKMLAFTQLEVWVA
jgi:CheY-like chemotaxis protein/predicted regulator of Ras-like GTPase activity (Roadblock/LC7/MglB family)